MIDDAERIARRFHAVYEDKAPDHGWKTQQRSRVPWEQVPAENRSLMLAVARELLEAGVILPGPALRL